MDDTVDLDSHAEMVNPHPDGSPLIIEELSGVLILRIDLLPFFFFKLVMFLVVQKKIPVIFLSMLKEVLN